MTRTGSAISARLIFPASASSGRSIITALSHCGSEKVELTGSRADGEYAEPECYSNSKSGSDNMLPCFKSTLPFGLVILRRKLMSFGSEMSCHNVVHFQKTLGMLRRFKALHTALSVSSRLM